MIWFNNTVFDELIIQLRVELLGKGDRSNKTIKSRKSKKE